MTVLRNIAIAAFLLWMLVDSMFVFRLATGAAENRDRFSLLLLMVGCMLTLWIAIGLSFTTMVAMHSVALQVTGMAVMAIGIVVCSTAIVQLGRFHTPNVAVRHDHQLKQNACTALCGIRATSVQLFAYLGLACSRLSPPSGATTTMDPGPTRLPKPSCWLLEGLASTSFTTSTSWRSTRRPAASASSSRGIRIILP